MSVDMNLHEPKGERGYIPISDHGLIGNLRTAALVSIDGSIESYCVPNFDSPSIFARILDKDKGGHFSITPTIPFTTKQSYLPSSNVLQTKFLNERGVATVTDNQVATQRALFLLGWTPPNHKYPDAAARPSEARAQELGVPFDKLVLGASTLRAPDDPLLTRKLVQELLETTNQYWNAWIRRSTYQGSWKEAVHRSALALKLLIYEPTGAVVASPTFSLPEYIGGTRNWDYRASWIRDSSFTLYALIRLGFTYEANAYMDFIFERIKDRNPDGSLNIMYTIHGEKIFPEEELTHLDGHQGSRPVRIGNGAIDHIQLDIYGELMDCIYLGQKFGKPLGYDTWVSVRELVDYVLKVYNDPDLYVYQLHLVPGMYWTKNLLYFTFINLGGAREQEAFHVFQGLRLADKRSLPCPRRNQWLEARDDLYEQIMHKAWNAEKGFFGQSYEDKHVLDSSLMIMPLVFFSTPADPRFLGTLKQILKTPDRGGLTSNGLVYRYDVTKSDDGVGGEEGTFCLCTLWCIEALARAGEYEKPMLAKAIAMFEDFLQYTNHLGLCTEEISEAGDGLGNAVQGFTHVTLISAAYNLSRMQKKFRI
ncbi:hypothetical protein EIP91_001901 [Steccherinum ochraceum]|uniref:GH15-like domain-containing protein n=1 Tax=Steccherinum ochraceum TaxID=92696 RepID=A0A4R0RJH8_9APHY|nr:hypothetical protein EIP91_001901 [Steccherinum ochraceum]